MTFEQYCNVIRTSVAEQGYEKFFPSLCVVGAQLNMSCLECQLSVGGEERVAKEWVLDFLEEGQVTILAYRAGNRRVHVCEIRDRNVSNKMVLDVIPYSETA